MQPLSNLKESYRLYLKCYEQCDLNVLQHHKNVKEHQNSIPGTFLLKTSLFSSTLGSKVSIFWKTNLWVWVVLKKLIHLTLILWKQSNKVLMSMIFFAASVELTARVPRIQLSEWANSLTTGVPVTMVQEELHQVQKLFEILQKNNREMTLCSFRSSTICRGST